MKKKIKSKEQIDFIDIANFKHEIHKGYEYVVYYFERGLSQHFTAYVKIPKHHPAYKRGMKLRWSSFGKKSRRYYRRDYDAVDLSVHGGLTFGHNVTKKEMIVEQDGWMQPFTEGFWVGWDYNHAGDVMWLAKDRIIEKSERVQEVWIEMQAIHQQYPGLPAERQWEWDEVEADCLDAIEQLIKLEKGYPKCIGCKKDFNPSKSNQILCWNCAWDAESNQRKENEV
jgi:hypothetical protein